MRSRLHFFLAVGLGAIALTPHARAGDDSAPAEFQYAAKVTCTGLAAENFHAYSPDTTINIHNPGKDTVKFIKSLVLMDLTQGKEVDSPPSKITIPFSLDPEHATAANCNILQQEFGIPLSTTGPTSFEGFLLITTTGPVLDVTGVYTTATVDPTLGPIIHTVNVEEVRERPRLLKDKDQEKDKD
jgi:hypothetical protein